VRAEATTGYSVPPSLLRAFDEVSHTLDTTNAETH
jgi:hypothetical protein